MLFADSFSAVLCAQPLQFWTAWRFFLFPTLRFKGASSQLISQDAILKGFVLNSDQQGDFNSFFAAVFTAMATGLFT